jgi:hypothetical protein
VAKNTQFFTPEDALSIHPGLGYFLCWVDVLSESRLEHRQKSPLGPPIFRIRFGTVSLHMHLISSPPLMVAIMLFFSSIL